MSTSSARRCLAASELNSVTLRHIASDTEKSSCLKAGDRIEARRQSKHEEALSELPSAVGSEYG